MKLAILQYTLHYSRAASKQTHLRLMSHLPPNEWSVSEKNEMRFSTAWIKPANSTKSAKPFIKFCISPRWYWWHSAEQPSTGSKRMPKTILHIILFIRAEDYCENNQFPSWANSRIQKNSMALSRGLVCCCMWLCVCVCAKEEVRGTDRKCQDYLFSSISEKVSAHHLRHQIIQKDPGRKQLEAHHILMQNWKFKERILPSSLKDIKTHFPKMCTPFWIRTICLFFYFVSLCTKITDVIVVYVHCKRVALLNSFVWLG